MTHLIVCREYPPSPFPPGGIGTYVVHMASLLASAGEKVHVIAQQWAGAPEARSESFDGRLVLHRVSVEQPLRDSPRDRQILNGLAMSDCPSQAFAWQVAQLAETLVETEGIDLIEAPDWEAPLYYLQVRRALGLGPVKQPPCLIHLHSPSDLIFEHNRWDRALADFQPLSRMEHYSVRAADGLVCPSRYLARGAEALFGLDSGRVQVIPYPMGETAVIERIPAIWASDCICFVGRLELRKGILEWAEAAAKVAASHSRVTFEFIGSDTSLSGGEGSVRERLGEMIPARLRHRFRFHASQPRHALMRLLAGAPVAVVPSLWENFPYSCIEAMSTGMPVLASPNGGMAEMVEDGRSGWLAPEASAAGFEATLRRVLATTPMQRAAMGREAAKAVRGICDNSSVLERHLALRSRLAKSGAERSRLVPALGESSAGRQARPAEKRHGVGLVVSCFGDLKHLPDCLEGIRRQTQPTHGVVLLAAERFQQVREMARRAGLENCSVVHVDALPHLAAQALLDSIPSLLGVGVLSEQDCLEPQCIAECEAALQRQPDIGILSLWRQHGSELQTGLAQIRPSDSLTGEFLGVVRAAALSGIPPNEPLAGVLSALALQGWTHLTYPDLVSRAVPADGAGANVASLRRYSVMASAQHDSVSPLRRFMAAPLSEKAAWIRRGLKQPKRTAQWVTWQMRRAAAKGLGTR